MIFSRKLSHLISVLQPTCQLLRLKSLTLHFGSLSSRQPKFTEFEAISISEREICNKIRKKFEVPPADNLRAEGASEPHELNSSIMDLVLKNFWAKES